MSPIGRNGNTQGSTMSIERERKFIIDINQAHQLKGNVVPHHLTQHYLSLSDASDELRIRRIASDFTDPAYVTTLKQGSGEYRQETEIPLLASAYLALSALSQSYIYKHRYDLNLPGLTLDTYRAGPARLYGVLELEQTIDTPDIGLFDPKSLGIDDLTEVTGRPDFSNRHLATSTKRKELPMPPHVNLVQLYPIIEKIRQNTRPTIITLSGPSGSGKTTLLKTLRATYGADCATISADDYYIGRTAMRTHMPEGHTTNFDHPAAIDASRLARDLAALRAGHTITKPLYDMKRSEPIAWDETITPRDIVIVEGIAANLPAIRQQSDLSLVVTAPIDERLRRRMARDIDRKGHAPEETLDIFMNHVEPSYQAYFAPHDTQVDYIIEG